MTSRIISTPKMNNTNIIRRVIINDFIFIYPTPFTNIIFSIFNVKKILKCTINLCIIWKKEKTMINRIHIMMMPTFFIMSFLSFTIPISNSFRKSIWRTSIWTRSTYNIFSPKIRHPSSTFP